MRQCLFGMLLLSFLSQIGVAGTVTAYHIGNSLTQGLPIDWIGPWAHQRGHTYQAGRHIQLGGSLESIWHSQSPGEFPIAPYGSFQEALPNYEFDALTLQPFYESLEVVAARISNFSIFANQTKHVYVYQIWPWLSDGDYRTNWNRNYTGFYKTSTSRDFYRQLFDRLPGDTRIIPTGEVIYELAERIEAGTLPGIESTRDLFREDFCTCHLNEFGMFALASTVYATFFGESPVGFRPPEGMSPAAGRIIQEVAWSVASNHSRTGLTPTGDFNADGAITVDDYAKWKEYFRGGISDASGYTAWRNAYPKEPTDFLPLAIPEPGTGALLVVLLAMIVGRCRPYARSNCGVLSVDRDALRRC